MPTQFTVVARDKWQNTGVVFPFSAFSRLSIRYLSGQWTAHPSQGRYDANGDPNGRASCPGGYACPGSREGMLVGHLEDHSAPFPVGNTLTDYQPQGYGALYLTINDDLNKIFGEGYDDNDGQILVEIVVG